MSPIMGLLPGRPAESLRPRLRRDRHDPTGRTSRIHRNPRTTADADPAPPDLGAGAAGAAAHTREEPGARDLDPQPEGQAARERPLRCPRTALAGRPGSAGR